MWKKLSLLTSSTSSIHKYRLARRLEGIQASILLSPFHDRSELINDFQELWLASPFSSLVLNMNFNIRYVPTGLKGMLVDKFIMLL